MLKFNDFDPEKIKTPYLKVKENYGTDKIIAIITIDDKRIYSGSLPNEIYNKIKKFIEINKNILIEHFDFDNDNDYDVLEDVKCV